MAATNLAVRRRLANALLRTDFLAFLHRVFLTVSPGDEFDENWHLAAMAHQLDRVGAGKTRQLIINVPPRSLKSITVSVAWVAWRLGHDPSLRFVCCSYSQELALKHARDCRLVMQSEWYRSAFPRTILSKDRNAEHDFTTTARGGRFSTSVGGTLTGRGGDIIIIDDPIKPEDAASESARKAAIEWFGGTLLSRLNDKASGAIVLVMQRLHEDDLPGHLLGAAGGWDLLSLPAIAEVDEEIPIGRDLIKRRRVGDLLHERRENRSVLDALKASMGSAAFSAQYQQAPIPADGALVQRAWFRRYDRLPYRSYGDRIVLSLDCASKEGVLNDYTVCITALVKNNEVYLLDVIRERLNFPDLVKRVIAISRRHAAPVSLLIEDAASGQQLIQHLWHVQPAGVPRAISIRPNGDKMARMSRATSRIEAGELLLPRDAPWLADFEREILGFPNGRYDDQVDALSQLLNWSHARPISFAGPIVIYQSGRVEGPGWIKTNWP
jgi:predicted phage terminase large subunit-like protein